jgi:protein gp37
MCELGPCNPGGPLFQEDTDLSNGLSSSRIPWLAACKGLRADYINGCTNTGEICAVRARGLCWAENMAHGKKEIEPGVYVCPASEAKPFTLHTRPEVLYAVRGLRKPRTIMWNIGGDAFCDGVTASMREPMWAAIRDTPEHTHVMLTKNYAGLSADEIPSLPNLWIGCSVTSEQAPEVMRLGSTRCGVKVPEVCGRWVSFEPVLGPMDGKSIGDPRWIASRINLHGHSDCYRFVVIGGLSDGNGRVVPPDEGGTRAEWLQPLFNACYEASIPTFAKNISLAVLREIVNPKTRRKFESMGELYKQWRDLPAEWMNPGAHV